MYYLIYIILVLSIIFQSLSIADKIGFIGSSLTSIILPLIFLIMLIFRQTMKVNEYTKKLIKLYVYTIFVSLLVLTIYLLFLNGDAYFWGQNIFIKGIKASIYFGEIIVFLVIVEKLQNKLSIKKVFRPIIITYLILFFLLIFEIINPIGFNQIFHNGEFYNRIRVTTTESSTIGTLFTVFFILSCYYYSKIKRNYINLILIVVSYLIFMISSGSKGYLICLIISIIIMTVKKMNLKKVNNITALIIGIGVLFLIFKYLFGEIYSLFLLDLKEYSSFATRSYTTYCAILIGTIYPFGVGTFLYPTVFTKTLSNNLFIFDKLNLNLNLNEILGMISSTTGYGVAAKVPIAQYNMYWGMIGTIYFIKAYWINIYKNSKILKKSYLLDLTFIFILISTLTYVSFENKYEIWLFISTIIFLDKNQKD